MPDRSSVVLHRAMIWCLVIQTFTSHTLRFPNFVKLEARFFHDGGTGIADFKQIDHFVVIHRRSPFSARLRPEAAITSRPATTQFAAVSCGCRTGFRRSHDSHIAFGSWSVLVQRPQPKLESDDSKNFGDALVAIPRSLEHFD